MSLEEETGTQTHTEERPYEYTRPSISPGESLQLALLTP